jgi:hypothetical protein
MAARPTRCTGPWVPERAKGARRTATEKEGRGREVVMPPRRCIPRAGLSERGNRPIHPPRARPTPASGAWARARTPGASAPISARRHFHRSPLAIRVPSIDRKGSGASDSTEAPTPPGSAAPPVPTERRTRAGGTTRRERREDECPFTRPRPSPKKEVCAPSSRRTPPPAPIDTPPLLKSVMSFPRERCCV